MGQNMPGNQSHVTPTVVIIAPEQQFIYQKIEQHGLLSRYQQETSQLFKQK